MGRWLRILTVAALAALPMAAAVTTSFAAAASPPLHLSLFAPATGQNLTISGSGCVRLGPDDPGPTVTVSLSLDPTITKSVSPATDGSWSTTIRIPESTPRSGGYVANAVCDQYTSSFGYAETEFGVVLAVGDLTAGCSTTSPPWPGGYQCGAAGSDWGVPTTSDEGVVTLDGTIVLGHFSTDSNGEWTLPFNLPAGTTAGQHTVTAKSDIYPTVATAEITVVIPSTSPTPTSTSVTSSTSVISSSSSTAAAAATTAQTTSEAIELASTGTAATQMTGVAVVLLGGGLALLFFARKRSSRHS